MPIDNLSELRREIGARNLSWRVREVADDEIRGLGAEDLPSEEVPYAEAIGGVLISELRNQNLDIVTNTRLKYADLWKHLKLRPRRFDWRDRGVIGPVTDQRRCGSCVSFATAGLVGAQAAIELGGSPRDLSEADQHFCSSHGAHCGGWNNHTSLDQVRTRGITTEASFPYMDAFDNPPQPANPSDPNSLWAAHCQPQSLRALRTYTITNFTAHNGDDRKTYLSTVGPMICAFTVYQDFDNYDGGVYQHVSGGVRGGHAVLVTGYDDDAGAWICRNSWGPAWAGTADPDGTGAGYFMLAYGDSNVDNQPFYGARGVLPPRMFRIVAKDLRLKQPVFPITW